MTSDRNTRNPGNGGTETAAPGGQVGSVRGAGGGPQKTVANMLGEMVWLLTQSPTHRHFALSDLEWLLMPPLLLEQYRIYYDGDRPVALALWAYLSEDAEKKLEAGSTRLRPDEWRAGGMQNIVQAMQQGGAGVTGRPNPVPEAAGKPQGTLWLVDLISPFATPENKLNEKILGDLLTNVFKGKKMKFHVTDPATGKREVKELGGQRSDD